MLKVFLGILLKDESIDIFYNNTRVKYELPLEVLRDGYIKDTSYITNLIKKFMKDNNIDKSHISVYLNTSKTIIRTIQVPMSNCKDIERIIEWQMRKEYREDYFNYITKYLILEKVKNNKGISKVLVIMLPKHNINSFIEISKNIDGKLKSISVFNQSKNNFIDSTRINFIAKDKNNMSRNIIVAILIIIMFLLPKGVLYYFKASEGKVLNELDKNKYIIQSMNDRKKYINRVNLYNDLCNYVRNEKRDIYSYLNKIKNIKKDNSEIQNISIQDKSISIDVISNSYNSLDIFLKDCEVNFENLSIKCIKYDEQSKKYYLCIIINV